MWASILRSVRVCVVCQTNGGTPLYAASQNGHVEVVRALVEAGAAPNQGKVRNEVFGWAWMIGVDIALCVCIFVCACACLSSANGFAHGVAPIPLMLSRAIRACEMK